MAKLAKSRVELDHEQLLDVIRAVGSQKTKHSEMLFGMLSKKYQTKFMDDGITPAANLAAEARAEGVEQDLMSVLVVKIFLITGVPEDRILPTSKLDLLGLRLTPDKKEMLRISLNRYLNSLGSNDLISQSEMTGAKVVNDLYVLLQQKMPMP